jgi:adenylate cyclase
MIILCRDQGRAFGLEAYYSVYVDRIRRLIDSPPPDHWNGVTAVELK